MTVQRLRLRVASDPALAVPRLYRYRRFDANELRLLVVASQVRFTPPAFFNDPWDSLPAIERERPESEEEWQKAIDRFVELTGQLGPEDPAEFDRYMARFTSDRAALRRAVEAQLLSSVADFRSLLSVLCLADSGTVPLMWSHYADSHAGLCLVFSTRENPFNAAFGVQYLAQPPSVPFALATDVLFQGILAKPSYWSYEGEYRLIATEREASRLSGFTPMLWSTYSDAGFSTIPPESFVAVILGARMSPDHQGQVRKILTGAKSPVELWRAHLESGGYRVRLEQEALITAKS